MSNQEGGGNHSHETPLDGIFAGQDMSGLLVVTTTRGGVHRVQGWPFGGGGEGSYDGAGGHLGTGFRR